MIVFNKLVTIIIPWTLCTEVCHLPFYCFFAPRCATCLLLFLCKNVNLSLSANSDGF